MFRLLTASQVALLIVAGALTAAHAETASLYSNLGGKKAISKFRVEK